MLLNVGDESNGDNSPWKPKPSRASWLGYIIHGETKPKGTKSSTNLKSII
jgi:hypothetical protein